MENGEEAVEHKGNGKTKADESAQAKPKVKAPFAPRERTIWGIGYIKRKLHEHKAKREKETANDKAARATASATKWMAFFTAALTILSALTWWEIRSGGTDTHDLAIAAKEQSATAKKQAAASVTQVGETAALAIAAKQQSDDTAVLATAAKEQVAKLQAGVNETHNLADAAAKQAVQAAAQTAAIKAQLSLYTAAQLPFIFLKEMPQSTEAFGDDTLIKWTQIWHNSGGSKPLSLSIWSDCPDSKTTETMNFYRFRRQNVIHVVLGPQTDRTIPGCETSYSHLKALDDANLRQARIDNTRNNMYIIGGADYKDFVGTPHMVEYCYQIGWDNRNVKFGFHLLECREPYQGHNCADEECQQGERKAN